MWPQEETRTKLGRKFNTLTYPIEAGSLHVIQGHKGRHQCWSGGKRVGNQGRAAAMAFIGVSMGNARQGKVNSLNLANLNNFGAF